MLFNKIFKNLSTRLSVFVIIASVAVFSFLLVFLSKLIPTVFTKLDTTETDKYTLSAETEKLIKDLDTDITVYLISDTGDESEEIRTVIERYDGKSRKIKFKSLNTERDSEKIALYTGDAISNSIVVESGKRFKYIPYYELFFMDKAAYSYAYQTYIQYYQSGFLSSTFTDYLKDYAVYQGVYSGYQYEEKITSAIRYVSSDTLKKAYILSGHDEDAPSFDTVNAIKSLGIDISAINADKTEIPRDAELLLLLPNKDITENEKTRISGFMNDGGRVLLLTSYGVDYKNLYSMLSEYGVQSDNKYLCEDNKNYNLSDTPAYIIPDVTDSLLAEALEKESATVLLSGATGIYLTGSEENGITVKPLLTTSPEAYTTENVTDFKFNEEKDTRKTMYAGVSAINQKGGGVVWLSSSAFAYEEYTVFTDGGNLITFMHYINMLLENSPTEKIPPVTAFPSTLSVPKWFIYSFVFVFCVILPVSVMTVPLIIKKVKNKK